MIIDKILDRKDGQPYNARSFYLHLLEYGDTEITKAMDEGTENDVKEKLCEYIMKNEYNPEICEYINNERWIPAELA